MRTLIIIELVLVALCAFSNSPSRAYLDMSEDEFNEVAP